MPPEHLIIHHGFQIRGEISRELLANAPEITLDRVTAIIHLFRAQRYLRCDAQIALPLKHKGGSLTY